jgi:hypothetical protein
MFYAMRAPVPASDAELATPAKWRAPPRPFVIDAGANVGWFTINAAAAGGAVAAFEAMAANIALLRASLCANPWLMDRIALYGVGLAEKCARLFCRFVSRCLCFRANKHFQSKATPNSKTPTRIHRPKNPKKTGATRAK